MNPLVGLRRAFLAEYPIVCDFLFAPTTLKIYYEFGLSDGVMVTQSPLKALFMVRIHVGQPLPTFHQPTPGKFQGA